MSRLWQTQKSHLTININSVHKGIKYKCDQCDKEFTTSAHRYVHIKSVHEHKKYPCTLNDYQAPPGFQFGAEQKDEPYREVLSI